jgi:uncharacterized protein
MKPKKSWVPSRDSLENSPWLRWLKPFLGHPRLWHWSRRGVAMGVALGVFFGLLIPVAQIPLSAAAAIILRANVPAAAASTLVTNPVTFAPIYYAAYQLGLWVTGEDAPADLTKDLASEVEDDADVDIWTRLKNMGRPLLIGLAIMSSLMGVLTYFVITLVWRWRVLAKRRDRNRA